MIPLHKYLLVLIILAAMLFGCSDNPAPTAQNVPVSLALSDMTHSETLKERNRDTQEENIIIEYDIKFPQIEEAADYTSLLMINEYYQMLYRDVMDYGYHQAYMFAKNDYDDSTENSDPFYPHAFGVDYEVKYNDNWLLSVQMTEYTYTGGAHPISYRMAHLFDTNTGDILTLAELFNTSLDETKEQLIEEVSRQIKEQILSEDSIYYEDYSMYLKEAFNIQDFYVEPDHLVLYFQQYAIAPYAAGFPEFRIPLTDVPYFTSLE